jgi:NADH-quinone oxidoreductase subunit L
MVTAGIFLILRTNQLFVLSPTTMMVATIFGLGTALTASLVGMTQFDIKRVIAYSTNSQLGFMMLLCGIGMYSVCFYHLVLHAFFKCLLFLCSGIIIHGLGDEQDMRKMGGLRKIFPFTYSCVLIGSAALIGWPFMSGFYSKDSLFEMVLSKGDNISIATFWTAAISAALTALYSTRLIVMVFFGNPSYDKRNLPMCQDADWIAAIPLLTLTIMSVVSGYLLKDLILTENLFQGVLYTAQTTADLHFLSGSAKLVPTIAATAGIGFCLAYFGGNWKKAATLKLSTYRMYAIQSKKFLYDVCYNRIARSFAKSSMNFFYFNVDTGLLEKLGPTGIYDTSFSVSQTVKLLHTGTLTEYIYMTLFTIITIGTILGDLNSGLKALILAVMVVAHKVRRTANNNQ